MAVRRPTFPTLPLRVSLPVLVLVCGSALPGAPSNAAAVGQTCEFTALWGKER